MLTESSPRRHDMTGLSLNWIANCNWGIADGVLRDVYIRGKYRDVIPADYRAPAARRGDGSPLGRPRARNEGHAGCRERHPLDGMEFEVRARVYAPALRAEPPRGGGPCVEASAPVSPRPIAAPAGGTPLDPFATLDSRSGGQA